MRAHSRDGVDTTTPPPPPETTINTVERERWVHGFHGDALISVDRDMDTTIITFETSHT